MILQENGRQKKARVAYSYQTNRFKFKKDNDKYGHYIMVMGIIHQEDINKCVPNMGVPEVHKTITNRYVGRN